MRIAILSDSHDNIWKLEEALDRAAKADAFIHCGDLCSPFVVKQLGEAADGRSVHIVRGNNDGDPRMIGIVARGFEGIHLHGDLAELTIDGVRIAVNHYPEIARGLAAGGQYDLVCYGHDHTRACRKVGDCTLLNPGEIMGMNGASTFAEFDTGSREVRFVEVD